MQQITQEEFRYLGLGTFPSVCRLRAFDMEDAPTIVIATELPHNPGTSVTNAVQDIAAQAYQWLERPARGITLIEHYEQDGDERYAQERFALVTFQHAKGGRFSGPEWRAITREEVERMAGRRLEDETDGTRSGMRYHAQLTLDAQFAEVAEKIEYLQSYANATPRKEQTQAAMQAWLQTAQEHRRDATDNAAQWEEAVRCLAKARTLYFDLYPERRAVEELLLEDHCKVQGKEITVFTLSVWREGAISFEDVALASPIAATIQKTGVLTFSWDNSDGENEAYCVPIWRIILHQDVPGAEEAVFVGVAGIHRSVDGRTFDPSQSAEPEYTWAE